jgi:hypothetical protein
VLIEEKLPKEVEKLIQQREEARNEKIGKPPTGLEKKSENSATFLKTLQKE